MSDPPQQRHLDDPPRSPQMTPEDAAADNWGRTFRYLLIFIVTTIIPVLLFWLLSRWK